MLKRFVSYLFAISLFVNVCLGTAAAQDTMGVGQLEYIDRSTAIIGGQVDAMPKQAATLLIEFPNEFGNIEFGMMQMEEDGGFLLFAPAYTIQNSTTVVFWSPNSPVQSSSTALVATVSDTYGDIVFVFLAVDIPEVEYDDLDDDTKNRIDDLQTPPIKNIKNAGDNEFKKYKNNTDPKLPEGGDYQEIYVKDGDKKKRFVYDWKNKILYYTDDHYESWKKVNDPWKNGEPKFPPPK